MVCLNYEVVVQEISGAMVGGMHERKVASNVQALM